LHPARAIATFIDALMHFTLLQAQTSPYGDPAQWLPTLALAVGAAYLFIFRPMKQRRKKADPMDELPFRKNLAQQRHVEREMQNLLVELSEMSRKMTAQIDSRTTKLEILLEEADAKIQALRTLQDNAPQTPADRFRIEGPSSTTAGGAVVTGGSGGGGFRSAGTTIEPSIDPRHAEVYALADQGRTAAEIAEGLRRPRGEIELILALRGK
jgi:hypothetical protein